MYIGYRIWSPIHSAKDGDYLESIFATEKWDKPVMETGKPIEGLDFDYLINNNIPNDPTIGYMSYNDIGGVLQHVETEYMSGYVMGAIAPFGRVVIHENGYRSEKAQIIALVKYVECDYIVAWGERNGVVEGVHCSDHADYLAGRYFFCEDHFNILAASDLYRDESVYGTIYTEDFFKNLSDIYQCDLVTFKELTELKEKYENGPW